MKALQRVLYVVFIIQCQLSFGQDTTRLFAPVPIFAAAAKTVNRIAVISSSIPHFELSKSVLSDIGATDIGDALKYLPGVLIRDYGGIGGVKTFSYRGLAAPHTAVLMDGGLIQNTQSGAINLSSFELFGLQKLSFSAGRTMDENASATAFLQTNTIALTSILAEKPKSFRLGVYGFANTINVFENGLYFQLPIASKFFIGAQVMSRFGSGAYNYSLPDLLGEQYFKRENASLFNWRTRVLAGYQHKKNKLLLSFTTFNNEQELPGAVVLYNPSNDQMLWNKDMRMMMRHTWQNKIWKITSTIGAENTYTRYLDPFFLNLQGFIDARYTNQNFNGGTMVNRLFQNNSLRVFLGSDLYFSSLKTNNIAAEPSRISNNSVIGVSKEFSKLIIDGNVSLQLINDEYTSNNSTEVNQFKQLSPFISVAYLPFKKSALKVRGFYKRTFRMPTFNDLYYNFIGNTMLKPEQGNMLNLGLAYTVSKKNFSIEITADAFLNYIQNKIIAIPTKNIFNWSMQNIGQAQIKGMDLALFVQLDMKKIKLQLQSNHSFVEALDKTDPGSSNFNSQLPYTPYYTNSTIFSILFNGIKFSSNVLFNGYRFSLNENSYSNLLPSFTDINIGLSKRINWAKNSALIDFKVMNLIGKNYEFIRSFPMPGRHLQMRLIYEFE